jgi:hypothetical protein
MLLDTGQPGKSCKLLEIQVKTRESEEYDNTRAIEKWLRINIYILKPSSSILRRSINVFIGSAPACFVPHVSTNQRL